MAIETSKGGTMITGQRDIALYRLLTLHMGLKAEMRGMRLTRKAPSCFSIVKKEFGLKGSKQKVFDAFVALLEQHKKDRETLAKVAAAQ